MPISGPAVEGAVGPSAGDMAPLSQSQQNLEPIRFDGNVQVRVSAGGKDRIVSGDADFGGMAGRLRAIRIHFPNEDHDTAVEMAAAWVDRKHGS